MSVATSAGLLRVLRHISGLRQHMAACTNVGMLLQRGKKIQDYVKEPVSACCIASHGAPLHAARRTWLWNRRQTSGKIVNNKKKNDAAPGIMIVPLCCWHGESSFACKIAVAASALDALMVFFKVLLLECHVSQT